MSKGSKSLITCVVAFLIISMGMSFFLFSTNVGASILGAKHYYLVLEKRNFKKLEKEFKKGYLEKYLSEYSYACKVNAQLEGDLLGSDPEIKTIADQLSKFELFFNYNVNSKDLKNQYYTSLITTKYDGKMLGTVDLKFADNKALIAFPGLTDKTIGIKSSDKALKFDQAYLSDDKAFEEIMGLTRDSYNKLVQKYLKDIIINEIPDKNAVLNTEAIFEDIECNSITFNINQEIIANIFKAVATEVKDDKKIKTIVTSITNAFLDVANEKELLLEKPTAEEIEDQIQEMCDGLNSASEELEEIDFLYTVYFENNGNILSRQFEDKLSDAKAKLSNYKSLSGVDIFNLMIEDDQETIFEVRNESKPYFGSYYEGKFNVDVTGKSLVEAKYKYDKGAKAGNLDAFVGEVEGKINLEQFEEEDFPDDIYFSFVNRRSINDTLEGKTKITSKVDGKSIGITVNTEVRQSNLAKISKPSISLTGSTDITDIDGMGELGEEIMKSLRTKFPELFPEPKLEDDSLYFDDDYYLDDFDEFEDYE